MEERLVTIIIPVYNGASVLGDSVGDVFAQDYPCVEVIVVNDGSSDGSLEVLNRLSAQAPSNVTMKVIDKANGGICSARNAGLDAATGDLIAFMDQDDRIPHDYVSSLVKAMGPDDEAVIGGTVDHHVASGKRSRRDMDPGAPWSMYRNTAPWGRLFKASLFDGIRFPLGIIYEDLAIIYPLLKKCSKISTTSRVLYGYRQHDSNSMRVFSPRRADVLKVCEQLEHDISQHDEQYLKAVRSRQLSAYFNLLLLSSQDKSGQYQQLGDRCWKGIKQLRFKCLCDGQVRLKNKIGILASLPGRWFLCSVIGRNYQPKP